MISTLEALAGYLDEAVIDELHALRLEIVDPIKGTLDEFTKLK